MNASVRPAERDSKEILGRIRDDYRSGLEAYLGEGGEAALQRAYALGRSALNDEVGVLELLAVHHEALTPFLASSPTPRETVDRAQDFLSETISSFEMTHRGFREANATLHRLNDRLESEVKRIAHVIHDDTGALLVTVHLAFKELERDLSPAGHEQLNRARVQLNELEARLRQLSHELRPTILDDLGLLPALRFLAQGVSARGGLRIDVEDSGDRALPPLVQTTLYRIVQEAFANTVRHAHASHAVVKIQSDDASIHCSIRDDGIGMRAPSKARTRGTGLGLLGIRERLVVLNGTLNITSAPGRGTELLVKIPLEA